MEKKTLKALKGSIEKWRKILLDDGADGGKSDCPLCALFHKDNLCDGCPVFESTGKHGCAGTPYVAWLEYHSNNPSFLIIPGDVATYWPLRTAHDKKSRKLAKKEYEFLKSLLPEGESA